MITPRTLRLKDVLIQHKNRNISSVPFDRHRQIGCFDLVLCSRSKRLKWAGVNYFLEGALLEEHCKIFCDKKQENLIKQTKKNPF